MIPTDTGPLVAILNRNDPNHQRCIAAASLLPRGPMLSTWPCFTEAMYLLHRVGGYPAQELLWELLRVGRLILHTATDAELLRIEAIMAKYRDLPMDFADASLIVVAENHPKRQVFTIDSDFAIYRCADGSALKCIPSAS